MQKNAACVRMLSDAHLLHYSDIEHFIS